jgi:putative chitinase
MLIYESDFSLMFPRANDVDLWVDAINEILPQFDIVEGPRLWMFLAQCGHESAGFTVFQENLNYSRDALLRVFPKYFNESLASQYARKPEAIANRVYANRMGNGNEASGDGWRYRGKGPIQITGKNNTEEFFASYFPEDAPGCIPDMLLEPKVGIAAACWFWDTRKINPHCDNEDIVKVTKLINGGTHGLDDRQNRYAYIKKLLTTQ